MVKKTEFYRLLKPSEVLDIEAVIKNSDLRMSFKTAVFTGMRYKELKLFAEHPEWFHFNRKIIIIPKNYTKTKDERKVNLTPQFSELLYYFLHGGHRLKYSVYQSWSANLRRWAALAGAPGGFKRRIYTESVGVVVNRIGLVSQQDLSHSGA